jgi:hypothetical protein
MFKNTNFLKICSKGSVLTDQIFLEALPYYLFAVRQIKIPKFKSMKIVVEA